jgi:hypothetical protein
MKYHDTIVRIRSNNEGNISFTESPDTICEIAAPDMAKKKPAISPFLESWRFRNKHCYKLPQFSKYLVLLEVCLFMP